MTDYKLEYIKLKNLYKKLKKDTNASMLSLEQYNNIIKQVQTFDEHIHNSYDSSTTDYSTDNSTGSIENHDNSYQSLAISNN